MESTKPFREQKKTYPIKKDEAQIKCFLTKGVSEKELSTDADSYL